MRGLQTGDIHYTPACGLPELREAIAGFYRTRRPGVGAPALLLCGSGAAAGEAVPRARIQAQYFS
jgi:aspartate/methionine/tyrosine aminotransferase